MIKKQVNSKFGTSKINFKAGSPLVIFLSGWDSFATAQVFEPIINQLHSSFGILTFDYLNTGESSQATQNYSIDEQVDEWAKYVKTLKTQRIVIACHSIGGIFGLRLAKQLTNVIGMVSIEPTTKEVAVNPPQNEEYIKKMHQYDGMSPDEMETMLKQKVNGCFEPSLAKTIWSTYEQASQIRPHYDCTDFPVAINNNFEFKIDEQIKSIIFTEAFRKAEFERSEYHNESAETIVMGKDHYLYWIFPNEIAKSINEIANK